MQYKLLFTTLLTALAASACGNDNGGGTVDAGVSDAGGCAVEPNFTSIHNNLLSTGLCASAGCHNAQAVGGVGGSLSFAGGIDESYNELTMESTFEPAAAAPRTRVKASDPAASYLLLKLKPNPPAMLRMPQGCDIGGTDRCRPACEIQAVEDWINAGALKD